MANLTIEKIEIDVENGFVWAENAEGENIFQACLKSGKKSNILKQYLQMTTAQIGEFAEITTRNFTILEVMIFINLKHSF